MQTEINLPLEIFNGKFSLEEIATMCLILASPHLPEKTRVYWGDNETCNQTTENLIEKNIIIIHEDHIEIDISEKDVDNH